MTSTFRSPTKEKVDRLSDIREDRTQPAPEPDPGIPTPQVSRIGFGCAGLMQSPSGRHRQRLLAETFEQGIRHFDVARMYGLGAAERELGQFARGRRDQMVIATKFGIEASGAAGRLARLQSPARATVARFPALRRALKRRETAFHQPHHYDAATARASLETSLKALKTDYVDIFFIHGPVSGDSIDMDELGGALNELRRAGLIRAWGFAGDSRSCVELSQATSPSAVLQIRDDIFDKTPPQLEQGRPVITFGVLATALGRVLRHLSSNAERSTQWTQAVGSDCNRPEVVAALLLQDALERNPTGTVLFSTTRPERVQIATSVAETFELEPAPTQLNAFRKLVLSEITPHVQRHRD
jgi:aryl-alcohol dehydrogenase-like predicted oxidoreductase